MTEEVVAKRANLLPGYIVCGVMGLLILVVGVVAGISAHETGAIFIGLVIGLLLIAMAVVLIIMHIRAPKTYIVYRDGKLHFADGSECYPYEITHVLLKLTRRNGIASPTGGIVLTINESRKIEYKYVDKVKNVEKRLGELYEYSRNAAIAAAQSAQNEQNAQSAQNAPAENNSSDPFGA